MGGTSHGWEATHGWGHKLRGSTKWRTAAHGWDRPTWVGSNTPFRTQTPRVNKGTSNRATKGPNTTEPSKAQSIEVTHLWGHILRGANKGGRALLLGRSPTRPQRGLRQSVRLFWCVVDTECGARAFKGAVTQHPWRKGKPDQEAGGVRAVWVCVWMQRANAWTSRCPQHRHTHMHTHTHIPTHPRTHTYTHTTTHMHTRSHTCTHARTCTRTVHTHTHTHMHTHTHTHTHTQKPTHPRRHTNPRTHTQTHTHTLSLSHTHTKCSLAATDLGRAKVCELEVPSCREQEVLRFQVPGVASQCWHGIDGLVTMVWKQ